MTGTTRLSRPTVARMGQTGLLLEFEDTATRMAWHRSIQEEPFRYQVDAIMAAATILITFVTPEDVACAALSVDERDPQAFDETDTRTVRIPVVYQGEDLEHAAELTGLSVEALIKAHTTTDWRADFAGFAPGFMYLKPAAQHGAPKLEVPRRDSPRTRVPEGSVALAGVQSAVYPQPTPGGWQLIGETAERMWDVAREQPSLLMPGDTVRFEAVREHARVTDVEDSAAEGDAEAGEIASSREEAVPADDADSGLVVNQPGPQCLIQDVGRPGAGSLGVGQAGAADLWALAQANDAVDNHPGAAALEILLGNAEFRAEADVTVAVAGAVGTATVRGPKDPDMEQQADGGESNGEVPVGEAFDLPQDSVLHIGYATEGMRAYLAVRGGFEAEEVLGSRSTDTLSGLGPTPLEAGDMLRLAKSEPRLQEIQASTEQASSEEGAGEEATEDPGVESIQLPMAGEVIELRYLPGPRDDWFGQAGLEHLETEEWEVSSESNRVGARLTPADDAKPLRRVREGELATEGMVPGALQVPPNGEPVLFLADHPVTGGYPVIGVVEEADLRLAAQLPPGARVQFVRTETA